MFRDAMGLRQGVQPEHRWYEQEQGSGRVMHSGPLAKRAGARDRVGYAAALSFFFVFQNIAGLAVQRFADRLHG